MKVFEEGIRHKVAVLPGMPFFVDGGGTDTIRLNFSNADEEKIAEGMHRLTGLSADCPEPACINPGSMMITFFVPGKNGYPITAQRCSLSLPFLPVPCSSPAGARSLQAPHKHKPRPPRYRKHPCPLRQAAVTISAQDHVLLETTMGNITIALDPGMPITAGNFEKLVKSGFYDGVIFHRVIPGFMIQGGDPTGTSQGGPGYTIPDEFTSHNHDARGTVAMANARPNTGGSQFFINLVNNTYSIRITRFSGQSPPGWT